MKQESLINTKQLMRPAQLLYIHPHGHLNDLIIPAGAIASMNSAKNVSKLGRYHFEVTDQEIRDAVVVAMDIQWSCGITGFEPLLQKIRLVNPKANVIVGGITAGLAPSVILAKYPVDFVIQGDSEVSFAALVDALLNNGNVTNIPNVHSQRGPPVALSRMTPTSYSGLDFLTADWFPTYQVCRTLYSLAFSMGPHIPVIRGCKMRCAHCYGSYSSSFGEGVLAMSSSAFVDTMRRANQEKVKNLRLVIGKPNNITLGEYFKALESDKLSDITTVIGIYLCTPPDISTLKIMEKVFPNGVTLSVIPPTEHYPPLSASVLAAEMERWIEAAKYVANSRQLQLDIWTDMDSSICDFQVKLKEIVGARGHLSRSTVWHMSRITDDPKGSNWSEVSEAVKPIWTFYAAKLLSPILSDLLVPYQFLDNIDEPMPVVTPPPGPLEAINQRIVDKWNEIALPTIPDLKWWVLPVEFTGKLNRTVENSKTIFIGDLGLGNLQSHIRSTSSPPVQMDTVVDYKGVRVRTKLKTDARGLALLPGLQDFNPSHESWCELTLERGVPIIDLRKKDSQLGGSPREYRIEVIFRVQSAQITVLDEQGNVLANGRADLGIIRKVPPRQKR